MNGYIQVKTVQENGKWYVQVVNSEGYDLRPGAMLQNCGGGCFANNLLPGEAEFNSRRLAREALEAYKIVRPFVDVTGGFH